MEKSSLSSLLFLLFLFLLSAKVSSGNAPAVFLFGDSILDVGNNPFNKNCTIQANFPPYGQNFFHHPTGRFTNGRTIGDFIAESLGIDLQKPYLEAEMLVSSGKLKEYPTNGINFASAGSGVLKGTNEINGVISLDAQVEQFGNLVTQNKIDKNIVKQAMYIFETGSNDAFFYFFPSEQPRPTLGDFVNLLLAEYQRAVRQLYGFGARKIAIFGLGPVGCIPARLNLPNTTVSHCYSQLNEMVMKLNLGMEAFVKEMPTKLNGAVGVFAATFDVVSLFFRFPQRYGFLNVTGACCGEGDLRGLFQCGIGEYELCTNPGRYVFWDYFHPSEHAYNLIFKAFWNGKPPRIRPINLKTLANLTISLLQV